MIAAIIKNDVVWVPLLLLVFNQVLKVSFSLLNVLKHTVAEVFSSLGVELCVVGVAIHLAVVNKSDTEFFKYFNERKLSTAAAATVMLLIYIGLTVLSLLALKVATHKLGTPLATDASAEARRHRTMIIGLLLGLSVGIGFMLLAVVIATV